MNTINIETPADWKDYELIDSGDGAKLERFGSYTIARTDPRALWQKRASDQWNSAVKPPQRPWKISYKHLTFLLRTTEFKHVGIFPEQAVNWDWLYSRADGLNILNLFAYTGGATLAAASAGAHVTHVDSVKSTIAWARENVVASNLSSTPIRWIEEDAYKFVLREGRRGNTYDAIIMDPPRFGRGSKGEVWKIEEDLPKLLEACKQILSPKPAFFLINAYTADLSSLVPRHMLSNLMESDMIEFGELALKETIGGRLLPNGIFARWSR
ncbi:class I SAM-dependent methyltransferase [Candidatus Gottesmanbacteria bacterium]|nr:class I SAM-dependent methyltransferase [Candidatus Gottesmanbacteria bacterium]